MYKEITGQKPQYDSNNFLYLNLKIDEVPPVLKLSLGLELTFLPLRDCSL